jgi:putative ABC transport system substrate-binding protein
VKRRDFTAWVVAAALGPLAARAQSKLKRVAVLLPFAQSDTEVRIELDAFRQELRRLGWTEGRDAEIEVRWVPGNLEQLGAAAREVVAKRPDIILTRSTPATAALLQATRTLPIVFAPVSDPVGDGFLPSLARPGGNVTGLTNVEDSLGGKWLELVKEIAPRTKRAGAIFNPLTAPGRGSFYLRSLEATAERAGVRVVPMPVQSAGESERAIETLAHERDAALIVLADVTNIRNRREIIASVARHRLPAVYPIPVFARDGGLMSYGVDVVDLFRRAAGYVDRILRGERPGELPVQGPVKFHLLVNLKTARALGFDVPRSIALRADQVIE